jgi:hypothetical protein
LLQTHYDILGIPKNAGDEQIKAAFRKLAKLYHPDKNPNGKEQFERILIAYEVLINSARRRQYDMRISGRATAGTPRQKTQSRSNQPGNFSEEELKRRRYYQENYEKEYKRYTTAEANALNKKTYNEYKYILFATPLAVALFMLVIRGLENTPQKKTTTEATTETITEEIKMGDDPYTAFFKNPVFATLGNRTLVLKNTSSYDLVVAVFNKQNKFIRCCVIKTGFFVELQQLPAEFSAIKIAAGNKWNSSKTYQGIEVIGGFEERELFYSINVAKTNGWTISIDNDLLNASEQINVKEFFKRD